MATQAIQPTKTIDEFASDEYGTGTQSLPYLQVLNHEDPHRAGFFIAADNAAAVNFSATQEWESHEAQFFSGGATMGYRSLTARLVILRRSPLLMFQREGKGFVGVFDEGQYNGKTMVLKTKYLVYLVDRQKQLLHDIPLQFTAKGSICGSFGEHYAQFRTEMNQAYGSPVAIASLPCRCLRSRCNQCSRAVRKNLGFVRCRNTEGPHRTTGRGSFWGTIQGQRTGY